MADVSMRPEPGVNTAEDVSDEIGMPQKNTLAQLVKRRHPDWKRHKDWWQLFEDTYSGGPDFLAGGYLLRHAREEQVEFVKRTERAYYLNYCQPIVDVYTSFISQKEVERRAYGAVAGEVPGMPAEKQAQMLTENILAGQASIAEQQRLEAEAKAAEGDEGSTPPPQQDEPTPQQRMSQTPIVFMPPAVEEQPEDPFNAFWSDVDGKGTRIEEFQKKLSDLSSIFGVVYTVVDNTPFQGEEITTKADEREADVRPFARIYKPINVLDWAKDEDGNYYWVLLKEDSIESDDPFVEEKERYKERYRLWTRDMWLICDKQGELIDEGDNEIGEVPIVPTFHQEREGESCGVSLLSDIARVNLALFNWCSLADQIIYDQTFSILAVPEDALGEQDDDTPDLIVVGTQKVMRYPYQGQPPSFISPDAEQLSTLLDHIRSSVDQMYRMASLEQQQAEYAAPASGVARSYDFADTSQVLAKKAQQLEASELEICRLVDMWTGGDGDLEDMTENGAPKCQITYPDHYDVQTPDDLLNMWGQVDQLPIDAAKRAWLKQYLPKIIPMDDQTKAQVHAEVDTFSTAMFMPPSTNLPPGFGGAPGGGFPGAV